MARSLQQIKTEIQIQVRLYPSLDAFKFPAQGGSQVSIFNLMITIVSTSILVFEKIHDIFKEDITALAEGAVSGNAKWLQNQMLLFQYGDTVQLDENYSPYYPVVDVTKQIVSRCAIIDSSPVGVKVAKGIVPNLEPLLLDEMNALKDYYYGTQFEEGIGFAGIPAVFSSDYPDRMYVEADVYYSSQLVTATVKAATITAIDNFFATFQEVNFNGTVFIIKLTDAIQAVTGVTRVVYTAITARDVNTVYGSATSVDFQGSWATVAGYIISEDTVTHTLDDSITMKPETQQ